MQAKGKRVKQTVSASADARPKRVTYKDQREKHDRKAQRRQKHTKEALQAKRFAVTVLRNMLEKKGSDDPEIVEALETFVEKSIDAAQYLLDKNEHEDAGRVLEDAAAVLKNEISTSYPRLLFKINYRQAELQNVCGLHDESLVYLRQAITMAEKQESIDGDPLACLPAETYLNMAIALQYGERLKEAVEAAQKAGKASQQALLALSKIQQQPKAFRRLTAQEAQEQLMAQTDIQIQSHLVLGQLLEKMRKYEEASQILQAGKRLLEQNFGAQHPLMSDFNQVEHLVTMQVAPNAFDPKRGPVSSHGGELGEAIDEKIELESENISALLDKRSDLMKRGRVKRIFYEVTDSVQVHDARTEFADLEELEEKQAAESMNSCAQTQQSWMQRQQLMAMRQQQDEQFRMMDLLISTRQRTKVECQHPQVYVPYQFNYPVAQQVPVLETQSSSSEPSDTTSEEPNEPSPGLPEPVRVPSPEPESVESSATSKSDSFECQSMNLGEMQNFQSEDSDSDVENPPMFIERANEPLVAEEHKPIRSAGREFIFKEKNFKSGIYLTKRQKQKQKQEPEKLQPVVDTKEWDYLSLVIKIQARVRRFLRMRRRKLDLHFGEICPLFYIRYDRYRFKIIIYKVKVAHTIKRTKTKKERTFARHRSEKEMQQVDEKVERGEAEVNIRHDIMYQILIEEDGTELGSSQKFISLVDFPAEFPYLIDYMRAALSFEIISYKNSNFKVQFQILEWRRQQEIIESIKMMIMNLDNRQHRTQALQGGILTDEDCRSISVKMEPSNSCHSRIEEEVDYDAIRSKIDAAEKEGQDMEALRLKIQWEARQLLEHQLVTSSQVRKIVHRDVRKEREWRDHIRLNHFRTVDQLKVSVQAPPNIYAIVKFQALVRGFLARRHKQTGKTWQHIFDFVVTQNDNYYLVRTLKAPDSMFGEMAQPYQIEVTRYLQPNDCYKQQCEKLPYDGDQCRANMIKGIKIEQDLSQLGNILKVTFQTFPDSQQPKVIDVPSEPVKIVEEIEVLEEDTTDEFIHDWDMPDKNRYGRFQIRKFTKYPHLIITFGFEQTETTSRYYVNVLFKPHPHISEEHDLFLNRLPVRFDSMMYFLRRYLTIYFTSADRLDYAAIQNFPGKKAFEWEMDKLRKTMKKQSKLDIRLQAALRLRLDNKKSDIEAASLNYAEVQMHNKIYVVKVIEGPEQIEKEINEKKRAAGNKREKYRILVYCKDDDDDYDYISVHSKSFYSREEMFQNIREHLCVYIDDETKRIKYAALTKVTEKVAVELDIGLIVKVQSVVRRWLVLRLMKRDFEGMVTRFIMKDAEHKGRCVRITIWKTLVEHTIKTKKTTKVKQRNSKGVVQAEEVKSGEAAIEREQIEAYQIVAQNLYLDENHHEKIVLKLPPRIALIESMKEAIKLKWQGTFSHEVDNLNVDWLDSITYTALPSHSKKSVAKWSQPDYSRYHAKVRGSSNWSEQTSCIVDDKLIVMLEATDLTSFDDALVKIQAFTSSESKNGEQPVQLGENILTVREVLALMRRSLTEDQMAAELVDELAQSVSYSRKHPDWDVLLRKCCNVLSTGAIFIDELIFQSQRYGFDLSQARTDMKAVSAALLMQRYIRTFLQKRRLSRLRRTPGYATNTGVYVDKEIYLVYLLAATKDQSQFRLTLKMRMPDGSRESILDKHLIADTVAQEAISSHQCQFKLQSVTEMFKKKILTSETFYDGYNGRNVNWKKDLVAAIQQDF